MNEKLLPQLRFIIWMYKINVPCTYFSSALKCDFSWLKR